MRSFVVTKSHVLVDDEYKFIRRYSITTVKANELSVYLDLVPDAPAYAEQEFLGDSAYWGEEYLLLLPKRGFTSWVNERGCGQKKLTEKQRLMNKVKSGVRCRVEHVFGAMRVRCRDEVMRTIGLGRAVFWFGMRNLAYNLERSAGLPKKKQKKV